MQEKTLSLKTASLRLLFGAGLILAIPLAEAATATHDYDLTASFNDTLGSANLSSNGGSIGPSGLRFGPDQGPSLVDAIDPSTYTIFMRFSLDATTGWRRLLDFKNRTTDNGLYDYENKLQFVVTSPNEFVTGSSDVFAPGSTVNLAITRDGASKQFIGYVDGVQQIAFTDSSYGAVFDATSDHIIQFLRDDLSTAGENSSGVLRRIQIFNTVLSPAEIAALPVQVPVPLPAGLWLFASAMTGLGLVARRKR